MRRCTFHLADFDRIGGNPDITSGEKVVYAGARTTLVRRRGVYLRPRWPVGIVLRVVLGRHGRRPAARQSVGLLPRPDHVACRQRGRQSKERSLRLREARNPCQHDRCVDLDVERRPRIEPIDDDRLCALVQRRADDGRGQEAGFLEFESLSRNFGHGSSPFGMSRIA